MSIVLNAAGGLALFLFAMALMTDGLTLAGGRSLRSLLERWTRQPLQGVAAGAVVTGLVQSSSAVTVATLGFVNAGMLSLRQALTVVFGANLGTTMTGWLVSLIGFGFSVEAFALPVLAIGVVIRLTAPAKRWQGVGTAVVGFALFFLGLSILKDALGALEPEIGGYFVHAQGVTGILWALLLGFVATLITQSSSAAIAVILTAATHALITDTAAAAAIIGANIGTTSTAALATIGATPNAKRVAAGHIGFNLITGMVALAILPGLLLVSGWMSGEEARTTPTVMLAMFHTVFNVLGIALMLPLLGPFSKFLETRFQTIEEDLARPRYLDRTLVAAPSLAIDALMRELDRVRVLVCQVAQGAIAHPGVRLTTIERKATAIFALSRATARYATELRMGELPAEVAERLPRALRVARYLEEASMLTPGIDALVSEVSRSPEREVPAAFRPFLDAAQDCLILCGQEDRGAIDYNELERRYARFEAVYQELKSGYLQVGADRRLAIDEVDRLLDGFTLFRRLIEQVVKSVQHARIIADGNELHAMAENLPPATS